MRNVPSSLARKLLRWIPALVFAMLALTVCGNLLGYDYWPLSKLVHFPVYWALLSLGLAVLYLRWRRWWAAVAALVLTLGFCAQVAWLWLPARPQQKPTRASQASSSLTVMVFNVLKSNERYEEVLIALKNASPDVIYLTEMTPKWHRALAPLSQIYPYRVGEQENLLLSLHPLHGAQRTPVNFDAAQSAIQSSNGAMKPLPEWLRQHWYTSEIVFATVLVGDKRVRIAGIHPPTPGSTLDVIIQRATALLCQKGLSADSGVSTQILMGDFNTTCFSPTFRFILGQTGLSDTAQGFGYEPTWGPRVWRGQPLLPWLGIPIDHVLVSPGMSILARDVGPALGSDHRWVRVQVALP